ncbi:BON domain-containing protein [bacterium]|nr:BON domain-containing protein [bacterium]
MREILLILLLASLAGCEIIASSNLESAVLDALREDPRTMATAFEVSHQGEGQVFITGEVSSLIEADAVTEIALAVEGVSKVVNNCHVEEFSSGLIQDEYVRSPFLY